MEALPNLPWIREVEGCTGADVVNVKLIQVCVFRDQLLQVTNQLFRSAAKELCCADLLGLPLQRIIQS